MNPLQLLVNFTLIIMLSFTHFQAFKLGRASYKNVFTRWLFPDEKATCDRQEPEREDDEPWYDGLI